MLSASITRIAVVTGESLGEPERLGDPALTLLVGVLQQADPVLVAVTEQPEELTGVRAAGDDHDLGDRRPRRAPRSRT